MVKRELPRFGGSPAEQIDKLLKWDKAVMISHNKHIKWLLSNGWLFVMAASPSGSGALNCLGDLKRTLRKEPREVGSNEED